MSWLSQNYEKASLGGAVVIALGLAFLGYSKMNGVEDEFAALPSPNGGNDPTVKEAEKVTDAIGNMKTPRKLEPAEVEGRPVDLFTGVPLFISGKTNKPVDLNAPNSEPIHPPIPNKWWLQYRIDPGFADSPQRDEDGDGYSNLEEFEAKTDPTDKDKYPAVINKLRFARAETVTWVLRPGFDAEGSFPFTYRDTTGAQNRIPAGGVVKPGEIFFAEGAAKGRFKLLGSEVRPVVNPKTNSSTDTTFVRVEDQRPNKKGKIYEVVAQFPEAQTAKFQNVDQTAVLKLEALGQGGTEFKVEENTAFGIPADSVKKEYFLKSVSDTAIEVEYPDPADSKVKKTIQIPKN